MSFRLQHPHHNDYTIVNVCVRDESNLSSISMALLPQVHSGTVLPVQLVPKRHQEQEVVRTFPTLTQRADGDFCVMKLIEVVIHQCQKPQISVCHQLNCLTFLPC